MMLKRGSDWPLVTLAAKAGMTEKTARKYLRAGQLPSQMKLPRDWRTREDPFDSVWPEVKVRLEQAPGLEALTLFEDLQKRHPGKFQDGQLRTLQRRVRAWRGLYGPDKEVFFPQVHKPGELALSDFTSMNALEITLGGLRFPHLLYHFVLSYSNWEYVEVCFSESFEALSSGLQNALWTLGKVPVGHHRTDNLSAATFKGKDGREFNDYYAALMSHYDLKASKNQPGKSHENGDVEQAHYRIKERVDQALELRGSRDFPDRAAYHEFLRELVATRNRGRAVRLKEELAVMRPLASRRLDDYRDYRVVVGPWSTIRVGHNTYSAPSRLIRYEVTARLHADRVEIHFEGQQVAEMERLRGQGKARINYRHVIGSLVRKPGAFQNYRYREEMFPTTVFRQTYDFLVEQNPRRASRRYLEILHWAALNSEAGMEAALREQLDQGRDLDYDELVAQAKAPLEKAPELEIAAPSLVVYDELLEVAV